MKLGDVLRKERTRKRLTTAEVVTHLKLSADEYQALEAGGAPLEVWGPRLARIAIKLQTPLARLISEARPEDAPPAAGQCGKLIKLQRERRGLTPQQLAALVDMTLPDLLALENGQSPVERDAPLLLAFARLIEQPIFNLFYPAGLPLDKLQDYP